MKKMNDILKMTSIEYTHLKIRCICILFHIAFAYVVSNWIQNLCVHTYIHNTYVYEATHSTCTVAEAKDEQGALAAF